MAQLSISAAARAAGKDRGTIQRYIKSGRISTSRDAAGGVVIETSELLRVFGSLQGSGNKDAAPVAAAPAAENSSVQHVLEATLELLKQQLKASQEREEKLLHMLEQEQHSRRDLEQRLLPPGTGVPPRHEAKEVKFADASDTGTVESTGEAAQQVLDTQAMPMPEADTSAHAHAPVSGSIEEKKSFLAKLFGK